MKINKSMVRCALIGGIIMFVFSSLFWGLAFWKGNVIKSFKNEERVAQVILDNVSSSGVYLMPNCSKSTDDAVGKPLVLAGVRLEGKTPSYLHMFGRLIMKMICAFLATWLLLKTNLTNYSHRVGFLAVLGLLLALPVYSSFFLKGFYTLGFTVFSMVIIFVQWFLAGLVIAKLAKK